MESVPDPGCYLILVVVSLSVPTCLQFIIIFLYYSTPYNAFTCNIAVKYPTTKMWTISHIINFTTQSEAS